MANQQGVSHIDQYVKGFPDGRSQVPQPEIMAGGCHEKKNQESQKTELLEGEVGQAPEVPIRRQEADERVFISEAMKLNDRKDSVYCAQQKSDDSQMAAIVKQGKKSRIQPAKRPDAQNHVQKQKRRGTCGPNNKRFGRGIGKQQRAESDEKRDIERDSCKNYYVVDALLAIPTNGLILVAHRVAPRGTEPRAGLFDFRETGHVWRKAMALRKSAGSNKASARNMRRWVPRRGRIIGADSSPRAVDF